MQIDTKSAQLINQANKSKKEQFILALSFVFSLLIAIGGVYFGTFLIGWRVLSLALFNARGAGRALRLFLRIRAAAPLRHAIFAPRTQVYKVKNSQQSSSSTPKRHICCIIYKNPLRGGAARLAPHRTQ